MQNVLKDWLTDDIETSVCTNAVSNLLESLYLSQRCKDRGLHIMKNESHKKTIVKTKNKPVTV